MPILYLYNMANEWEKQFVDAIVKGDSNAATNIKSSHVPHRLYKYCPLDEYSLKNIKDNTIWLSYPEKVNDPYDTSITVNEKRLANDSFRNGDLWMDFEKQSATHFTEEEKKQINQSEDCAESFRDIFIKKNPISKGSFEAFSKDADKRKHRKALEKFNNYQKKLLRFCSFSERVDSLLMWSHYAKHHTGICIEYVFSDTPNLLPFLFP